MVNLGKKLSDANITNQVVDEDGCVMNFNFAAKSFNNIKSISAELGDVEYLTTTDIESVIVDGSPSPMAMSRLNMKAISSSSKRKGVDYNIFFFFSEKMSRHLSDLNVYDVVDLDGSIMRYNFCSTSANDAKKLFSEKFDDFVLLTKTSAFSLIINGDLTSTAKERVDLVSEHLGYFIDESVKINNLAKLKSVICKKISK